MTPYAGRLCCLSLAVLCVVQLAAGLVMRLLSPLLVRLVEGKEPARAAGLLMAMRWFPAAAGAFVAVCVCAPIYVRLEPVANEEELGLFCVSLAALALLSYLIPVSRALLGAVRSEIRLRLLVRDVEERAGLYVIRETSPAMALAGLFHSRVVVSREVVRLLTPPQLDAAQRHEQAHRESHDNWKRLLLEAAPLDFCGQELMAAWVRFTEWSADDRATAGDTGRSVALASALVSVARLGSGECIPQMSLLVADGKDLRARVERLLEPLPRGRGLSLWPLGSAALTVAVGLVVAGQQPVLAAMVHRMMEALVD